MAESFASQHTQTFPDFLSQMGVSVLVSTYQAGKLIHLRHQNGVLNTHFLDMQKPMGMALKDSRLAIGTSYQVWDCYNMADVAPKVEPLNTHDACYLPRGLHVTGEIDIHEMSFADDNELWLVNTKMSCLCTLSAEHSVVPKWRPPFITAYDLNDRCHLNGLAMRDGKPAYVSALGTSNTAAGWRENKAAGGILMEVETNRMIASGLSMPHSPRWYQDKLWVLESGAGSLATVDIESGELTTIVELPGFTRGLDFIGRYAFIGLSQVRETAVFAGLPLTQRCQERECGVYIVDIVEQQIIAFVVFSGDVQEIFSVQLVPARFPVVLPFEDPLLRSSYSLPDEALENLSDPDPIETKLIHASSLVQQNNLEEAIAVYQKIIAKNPAHIITQLNLGYAYLQQEQWNNAIDSFQQIIEKESNHADAYNALGQSWEGLKQWEKAKDSYKNAIKIDQQFAIAHVNYSLVLLRQGKLKEGWKGFEWRWKVLGISPLDCPQSQWQGEDIHQKAILVHSEQSDSDIILCARFLPLLAKRCERLIVLCTEPFRLFFKSIEGVDEVRVQSAGILNSNFDVYSPIMSLPQFLEIVEGDRLAASLPFWRALKEVVVSPLQSSRAFKVGLIWRSHYQDDFIKGLMDFAMEDIDFYSLQTGLQPEESALLEKNNILNLEQEMVSYAHAGVLLEQLDLLISVDCPLAHLAGSLGVKTLLVSEQNPQWYWMDATGRNQWYPEMEMIDLTADKTDLELINRLKILLNID